VLEVKFTAPVGPGARPKSSPGCFIKDGALGVCACLFWALVQRGGGVGGERVTNANRRELRASCRIGVQNYAKKGWRVCGRGVPFIGMGLLYATDKVGASGARLFLFMAPMCVGVCHILRGAALVVVVSHQQTSLFP
jgi:hypothetical protein